MLARRLGFKVALVLLIVSVALVAAAAVAATSSDRGQPAVSLDARAAAYEASHGGRELNTQAIHPDRGGSESGDQVDGTTDATQAPAPATTSPDEPTRGSDAAGGTTGNSKAIGPDATAQARSGLCQAFADTGHTADASNREDAIAYRNLAEAAAAAGQSVADFCADDGSESGMPDPRGPGSPPVSPESGRSPRS